MSTNITCEVCNNTTEGSGIFQAKNEHLLPSNVYLAMGIYLSFVGTLAITGNAFVVFVLLKGKAKFQKVYGTLVLNLAVADLLLSVVEFPITAASSFYGSYILPDVFCVIDGFWVFTMALVDMNTLAAISICRYITACKQQYDRYLNGFYAKRILGVIWGYALIWTVSPLVGWSSYTIEAYGTSCTIDWTGQSLADKTYNALICVTCYFIHLMIFIFCYLNIIQSFRKANKVQIQSEGRSDGSATEAVQIETVVWYHKVITSRQMTVLSLAMVGTYVLAWTPYAVLTVYVICISKTAPWVHVIPTMLAKSACLSNPIVYILTSSKFREAAVKLLKSKKSRVAPGEIQLEEQPHPARRRSPSERRCYRGDITSRGIYIGTQEVVLPVERHVF